MTTESAGDREAVESALAKLFHVRPFSPSEFADAAISALRARGVSRMHMLQDTVKYSNACHRADLAYAEIARLRAALEKIEAEGGHPEVVVSSIRKTARAALNASKP